MSYRPPTQSLDRLTGVDFSRSVEILQNWKSRFDRADTDSRDPSKCKDLFRFPDGTLFYEAKAAICADGWSRAESGDGTGQSTTSVPLIGGRNPVYFDATKAGHRQFMSKIKQDARYVASRGYRFTNTILHASAL